LRVKTFFSGFFGFILTITLLLLLIVTTFKSTLLNPDFVTNELDKLDIYSIATQQLSDQLSEVAVANMPAEMSNALEGEAPYETIRDIVAEQMPTQMQNYMIEQLSQQLPEYAVYMPQIVETTFTSMGTWMEEQIDTAARGVNAYLTEDALLSITVSLTELKPVLKDNLAQAMRDNPPSEIAILPAAAQDAAIEQVCAKIDSEIAEQVTIDESFLGTEVMTQLEQAKAIATINVSLKQIMNEVFTELEPWIKEQTTNAVNGGYAYLQGETEHLSIVIPMAQMKTTVSDKLEQIIRENIPTDTGVSRSDIDNFIAEMQTMVEEDIPQEFAVDEELLGTEVMTQLERTRDILGYTDTVFKGLIGLAVLMVALIAFLQWRRIKDLAHHVGVACTIAGAVSLTGALVMSNFLLQVLSRLQLDIPTQFTEKASLFASDLSQPMVIYASITLVVGVVLLVISKRLKPSAPEPHDTLPRGAADTSTPAEKD